MTAPSWRTARHVVAVAAGLAVFALIFAYTGDADLLFAVGSGVGASLLIYLGALAFNDAAGGK